MAPRTSRPNRRQFLEESMWAAAAMATADPGELLWGESASRSALDQLGVAVIGVRGRGHTHLGFFAGRCDTRVLYVCDVDEQVGASRVAQVARRQGGHRPTLAVDLRRVLDDPRVDIVSIATPHHWHALAALWAMQAGKDVYVEKPVSHNVREGRCLVRAARHYERICQSGLQTRSSPALREAIRFVRRGGIGRLSHARAICYKHRSSAGPRGRYPVPPHVDYDLWLGPAAVAPLSRPRFHHDWHWQWPYGNGELGCQGLHPLDFCRWGLGLPTVCRSVVSWGGRFARRDAAQTTNTQLAVCDFGGKSIVVETCGLSSGPYQQVQVGAILQGSDGYLAMMSQDRAVAFDTAGNEIQRFHCGGGSQWHFLNFLQAVRRRNCGQLNADIEEGHITSALVHLANISYRLGRPVAWEAARDQLPSGAGSEMVAEAAERMQAHLGSHGVDIRTTPFRLGAFLTCDPATETIVNHVSANRLLSRDYRSPFVMPATGSV
jgi:predicted dehydrogenase